MAGGSSLSLVLPETESTFSALAPEMEMFFLWVLLELDPDASGWNLSWDVFFLADEFSPFFSSSEMSPWTFSLLLGKATETLE